MTVKNRKGLHVTPHDAWAESVDSWNSPLWNRAQVLRAYGNKSVSWLYAEMAAARIPRPVRIGANSVAWPSEQIKADIAAKIAAGPVELTAPVRRRKVDTAPAAA